MTFQIQMKEHNTEWVDLNNGDFTCVKKAKECFDRLLNEGWDNLRLIDSEGHVYSLEERFEKEEFFDFEDLSEDFVEELEKLSETCFDRFGLVIEIYSNKVCIETESSPASVALRFDEEDFINMTVDEVEDCIMEQIKEWFSSRSH